MEIIYKYSNNSSIKNTNSCLTEKDNAITAFKQVYKLPKLAK